MNSAWSRYVTFALGIWLVASSKMFNESPVMQTNDAISGILIIIFSLRARNNKHTFSTWLLCLTGIWLQLAPLLFWAPSSASYVNDTLVGAAVIAFSILLVKAPGEIDIGPEVPPGWSYNPSAWLQRIPVAFLAFFCFLAARYMASYQLGHITTIYDPLFDQGTFFVITSDISKSFPISDAGLGSAAYLIEALMALKGGSRRWHTMPWMVTLFGFLVVPVGLVSIILIMLQPLVVGHWCFWCLLTALFMLCMIALTIDEVAASIQFLSDAVKSGKPFWQTFWKGSASKGTSDQRSLPLDAPCHKLLSAMRWGVTTPWNLLLSTLVGIWLMFSPGFIQLADPISIEDHILGALATAISVIAMAEPIRALRYLNILFGLCLAISPWVFQDASLNYGDNLICGALLVALSVPRGKVVEKYGKLDKFII